MQTKSVLYNTLIPLLFVFLWSTGFIGAKLGLPYADPLTFLFIRMWMAATLFYIAVSFSRSRWSLTPREMFHASIVGMLFHALYLGGVFVAISLGTDAGFSALIVSMQPLLTVLLAYLFLGEHMNAGKLTGIGLGLAGACLVIVSNESYQPAAPAVAIFSDVAQAGLALCLCALLAISVGTIYQKKFCANVDLLPSGCIQYVAAATLLLPMAATTEPMTVVWHSKFAFALLWLVLALSLGAVLLLMLLIRRNNAGNVASLFYLVPPFTAVEAWLLFGETVSAVDIVGIALIVAGLALVLRQA